MWLSVEEEFWCSRFTCGFVLITESAPKKQQNFVGVAFAVGDVVVTLYITFLLRYATNDASTIVWLGLAINCVAFILVLWLVDSPTWMASLGHEAHAAKAFAYIARFNRVSDFASDVREVRADKFGETGDSQAPEKSNPDQKTATQTGIEMSSDNSVLT